MISSKPFRVITALIVLMGLLFTQLSVASCQCPGMLVAAKEMVQMGAADKPAMSGCADMGTMQPGLCPVRAQKDMLSLDKPDFPQVPPFVAVGIIRLIQPAEDALPRSTLIASGVSLAFATAPPLAIQHCCFRI